MSSTPHSLDKMRLVSVIAATLVMFAGLAAMLFVRHGYFGHLGRVWTIAASSAFVAAPLLGGGLGMAYGRAVIVALIGCWFGDVLGPRDFILGLAAFLVGHLAFITAFALRGIRWQRCAVSLVPQTIATLAILVWLMPHVHAADRFPVIAYILVINGMLATAAGASEGVSGRIALAAAVIFFVSDIFVARWRYVNPSPANAYFCYPLYYTACILFGWSVYYAAKAASLRRE